LGAQNFTLGFSLTGRIGAAEVRAALDAVTPGHPMLRMGVRSLDGTLAYVRQDGPFRAHVATGALEEVWARTLGYSFEPGEPWVAATLVPDGEDTTLLLTFRHELCDGRGALQAAADLVAVLDGARPPEPRGLPVPQEDLLSVLGSAAELPAPDPALQAPSVRHGDAMARLAFAALDVTGLLRAARDQRATLQGMLGAAVAAAYADDLLRVYSPISLLPFVGDSSECALRILGTVTAIESGGFWETARRVSADVHGALRPGVLRAMADVVVDGMNRGLVPMSPFDHTLTNLGVTPPHQAWRRVRAVQAPAIFTRVGSGTLSALTHNGRLTLTAIAHTDPRPALDAVVAALTGALR
jgi:hypothetical protein